MNGLVLPVHGRKNPKIIRVVKCITTLKIYADFCPLGRMSVNTASPNQPSRLDNYGFLTSAHFTVGFLLTMERILRNEKYK